MATKIGAAAIILDAQGHVLLVKHTYGHCNWEVPGGGAEAGESVVETAIREVREEAGLCVVATHTTGVYYEAESDMVHFVFLCQPVEDGAAPHPDGQEISACGFWPVDALPRPIHSFTVQRIHDALLAGVRWPLPQLAVPRAWLE